MATSHAIATNQHRISRWAPSSLESTTDINFDKCAVWFNEVIMNRSAILSDFSSMEGSALAGKLVVNHLTTDLSEAIESALLCVKTLEIHVTSPERVRTYLQRYPDLIDKLEEISQVAVSLLGEDTGFSLDVYNEPETDDEYLLLLFRRDSYDESLFDTMVKIDTEVGVILSTTKGWISVNTDFSPHRK